MAAGRPGHRRQACRAPHAAPCAVNPALIFVPPISTEGATLVGFEIYPWDGKYLCSTSNNTSFVR
ncbi:hypothetical protein [Paenibacillus lutrae]|uniref:Uncharacterized protein n=1 Tax=Paenibacillus lutrae TaxID=2078573 RepID=A0A7X3K0C1_9BACL|nr:hypothetical protein [Paenibacillus lutrae]MVP00937.1 hypothetical protein [Paenibacillus lutrae]